MIIAHARRRAPAGGSDAAADHLAASSAGSRLFARDTGRRDRLVNRHGDGHAPGLSRHDERLHAMLTGKDRKGVESIAERCRP
jgi:hypothetical protein